MISKLKNKILEKNFFMPEWYSIFINPYFTIRRPLYINIKKWAKSIDKDKKILDVGCGLKPYKKLFYGNEYIGIDIKGGGHDDQAKVVHKFFDGQNIPYEDNKFDALICTEVLEHSEDPDKLLAECNRVLKKNGQIYISMPFVYPEHETPFDFRRYTQYGHKQILKKNNFEIENIKNTTGVFRVCGQLISAYIFESAPKSTILKLILNFIILAPLQLIFILLDFIFKNDKISLNYIVIANKK